MSIYVLNNHGSVKKDKDPKSRDMRLKIIEEQE